MKRLGHLYQKIHDFDNLRQAEANARKGKKHQPGVKLFDQNPEGYLLLLQESLINKNFKTSQYETFTIYEPKERVISKLPYFPDRVLHHAVLNVLKPYFHSWFTANTYANIDGRGVHLAIDKMRCALQNKPETLYCLKMDIKKFYPNVDHAILKQLLQKKFKDEDLLWLLFEVIDSADGLPIGNYLSQYLANFYLTFFDHWVKEQLAVKYYFRYANDMIILASNKPQLHHYLHEIKGYLKNELNLDLKHNYQIFPVEKRGIRTLGYVVFHTHVLLAKHIKKSLVRAAKKKRPNQMSIASLKGWAKHANTNNLINKLLINEQLQ